MKKIFLYGYKLFYNNLSIYALIAYFCFVLIGLIDDYKKCLFS